MGIAVEAMIAARPVAALAVVMIVAPATAAAVDMIEAHPVAALAAVDMIAAPATAAAVLAVETAETAVVVAEGIAGVVEAGIKAEEENLPAPGLARASPDCDVADSECQPQAKRAIRKPADRPQVVRTESMLQRCNRSPTKLPYRSR